MDTTKRNPLFSSYGRGIILEWWYQIYTNTDSPPVCILYTVERMRTSVRHISYGIRHYPVHTLLSRMFGTITTLTPLYLVFQHFPIEMNRLSSRWSSSTHGTSALTRIFDSKHMDVKKKRSATLMFVSSKARIGLSTWLNEPQHCS